MSEVPREDAIQEPSSEKSSEQPTAEPEPYTIYTKWQKRGLISAASIAAFFSPMTAAIYMPALNTLADAEHVSLSAINFTVTSYLVSLAEASVANAVIDDQ